MSSTSYGFGQYVAGEAHRMWMPPGYRADGSSRVVVWGHGAGGNYAIGPLESALIDAGFPMIACDLGGLNTWGSDTSAGRVTTAWNYAITKFGVKADKAILWGGSMGSLTMLNYLKANPANVAACGMALPIVDPEDVRVNNRGGFQAAIEAVYGAATPVPNSNRPNQNVGSFGSVPVAMWGSDDDTVGQSNLATAFATAIGAQYTSFGAHGHAYEAFVDVKQVLTFLNQFK